MTNNNKPSKISFILPYPGNTPGGGFKIMYEYADQLAKLGHECSVFHAYWISGEKKFILRKRIGYLLKLCGLRGGYKPRKWFKPNSKIRLFLTYSMNSDYFPSADFIINTAWETARYFEMFPIAKGRKIFLVQHYEHYMSAGPEIRDEIKRGFNPDYMYISISKAVSEMLHECGITSEHFIPNGLNFNEFKLLHAIDSEKRIGIGFAARTDSFKGLSDAIIALNIIRAKYSSKNIMYWSYGHEKPDTLPSWIVFHRLPSTSELCELYNSSFIFMNSSHFEGWGLPSAEAMACGCALVSTDNGGVNTYAHNGQSALISPPKQPELLAQSIIKLIENPVLRRQIAHNGNKAIQEFTWERAAASFDGIIKKISR